jgi:N-glycosylase/DNA lyase
MFIKLKKFNPVLTLTGGQAFRWKQTENNGFFGIVGNDAVELRCEKDGVRLIPAKNCRRRLAGWGNYFDAETDYEKIIACFSEDETLREACKNAHGLRLLKQEPFETLISFIISQNNNIPRIKSIIERLCESFGEEINVGARTARPSEKSFAFPTAEALVNADLAAIGAGYRSSYINDAARKVQNGEIDLEALFELSADEARSELLKIKGVGEKVADCVLLFAYGKSTFPKDVHIKRALSEFYPDGLPPCTIGCEGIAQQYLFEYYRNMRRK